MFSDTQYFILLVSFDRKKTKFNFVYMAGFFSRGGWYDRKVGQPLARGLDNVFSRFTSAGVQRGNVDRTIAANRELAEYQYSKDLEMWQRGNEYNAPLAQMERLKAAGLNPNLVYGSGSAAGNAAGQLPKYSAPNVQYNYKAPVDFMGALSAFQDVRMRNAQIDNVRSSTAVNLERAPLTADQALLTRTKQEHEATKAGSSYLAQQQMRELFPFQREVAKLNVDRFSLQNEERVSDILYKNFRNDLARYGITSGDNVFMRMFTRAWMESGAPLPSLRRTSKSK